MAQESLFDTEFDRFLNFLKTERQLSPRTIENYGRDLQKLKSFCSDKGIEQPGELDNLHVQELVATLHRKGLSGRSLQRVLSSLRNFFGYLMKNGSLQKDPAQGIRAPKSPKALPKTLDVDQVNQLVSVKGDGWIDCRDRAILELFYSSGLRLSELVNLDIPSLDLADSQIRVTGKGNKTRQVPVGRYAKEAIRQWLKIRNTIKIVDTDALFVSKRGKRLGQRSIQQRLRHYSVKQGMDGPVNPHMLRHSFASHMLESSGDLRAVQELLGHANISTTQVYTHLDFQHLSKVYDKAHPRASRKPDNSGGKD
jgi:integrase/recombinase XerC